MDANGVKPPQEPKDVPSMMQEMMEKMCCSGELSPADMCRRMISAMRPTVAEGQAAPKSGTPAEKQQTRAEHEACGGCCGPQSRRESKGP